MKTEEDVVISMLKAFGLPLPKQQRSLDSYHRILRSAQECVAELGYSKTRAVAGAECNTVIELKLEHHAA
ncbi:hypothetical protein HSX01_31585 [Pseudomonas aeruginosa]|uniref:hypothetical protein n=1 Tax=Pseudomonas aeruginosa TaxID=287 RepID=UPI00156A8384|nr:hypothetical protein [Pseudomonas aeruginosa]NRR48043.1 hypothetical protein [Pseudomonas aeruginosa]